MEKRKRLTVMSYFQTNCCLLKHQIILIFFPEMIVLLGFKQPLNLEAVRMLTSLCDTGGSYFCYPNVVSNACV